MIQVQITPQKFIDKPNRPAQNPLILFEWNSCQHKINRTAFFKSNQLQWGHLDTVDVHRAETIQLLNACPRWMNRNDLTQILICNYLKMLR